MENQNSATSSFYLFAVVLACMAITAFYWPNLGRVLPFVPDKSAEENIRRAKLSKVRENIRELAVALEVYHVDHGNYPKDEQTLYNLTTPVAYITVLPTDGYSSPKLPKKLYYYTAADAWVIGSRGPDGDIDIKSSELPFEGKTTTSLIPYVYDVTNGATSSGDVIRLLVDHNEMAF